MEMYYRWIYLIKHVFEMHVDLQICLENVYVLLCNYSRHICLFE